MVSLKELIETHLLLSFLTFCSSSYRSFCKTEIIYLIVNLRTPLINFEE